MSGALKPQPLLDEIAAQDALAHQFRKLGLEFSGRNAAVMATNSADQSRPFLTKAERGRCPFRRARGSR
jgi:hypothetical protein